MWDTTSPSPPASLTPSSTPPNGTTPATTPQRRLPRSPATRHPLVPSTNQVSRPNHRSNTSFWNAKAPVINSFELKIMVKRIPVRWTTWDIHRFFARCGNVSRIDVSEDKTTYVSFSPAPADAAWVAGGSIRVEDVDGSFCVLEIENRTRPIRLYENPSARRKLPEVMTIELMGLKCGVMQSKSTMAVLREIPDLPDHKPQLTMDLRHKAIFITFAIRETEGSRTKVRHFKLRIEPAQIRETNVLRFKDAARSLVITLKDPPVVYRRTWDPKATHDNNAHYWHESSLWFRQTDIDDKPSGRNDAVQLRKNGCVVDVGRWLTYSLIFSKSTMDSAAYEDIAAALENHNVNINGKEDIGFENADPGHLWDWLDASPQNKGGRDSPFSELLEMADDSVNLLFPVRYQLEVCLSQGVLHECNMDKDFMKQLSMLEPERAVKVLEKVADSKERYYSPGDVLRLQNQVSVVQKKRPAYCTRIPSVTVTPTTVYFSTPVLETSNRVIRHFQKHEDHFLRVKFLDERYKGKIMSSEEHHMDAIFSRIDQVMTRGIKIADRHYEFLAFGSSQFREHGAYFFCSTSSVTAEQIRAWMGNFTDIKVVAKYCARIGQCFSTTRAVSGLVNVERIPDVKRNGFCFTDGVGKISPFFARLIAHHFAIDNSETDFPSMFQFRLAGCKGVLAVDPALKGTAVQTIQIRPSQEKFPAKFYGLEICRISQFSAAYLNVQLILILSTLGVPDGVFVTKLRNVLVEFSEAMVDEHKASVLLQKYVDLNQMTINLAAMISDGFMETQEPFFVSCLRLWRSWSLKYLKEKARIYVGDGAFVLGGTDETGTLKGHFDKTNNVDADLDCSSEQTRGNHNIDELPEIFLQIPDPSLAGKYRVVEGVCILTRNPGLHPGDVRVVKAVDVPGLRHMKNVVILPQTGDRDLANMCSGGDLDGDDYLVMWDKDLFPQEWNHPPMDYTAPTPAESQGQVTVADMTKFFIKHIRHNNLGRIAVAHRCWADREMLGVKDPKCLELAQLHSKAVDFVKTGVEAHFPKELFMRMKPHWAAAKKGWGRTYKSNKVLGKLFDEVKKETFQAAWDMPFDERIVHACVPTDKMLQDAKEIKNVYDNSVRRIMTQHGISSEFEVWTTFVLDHANDSGDYKFGETMGEISSTLKQQHQELCYEAAGTTPQIRDWEVMKPFIVAMYIVTADEVSNAVADSKRIVMRGGREVFVRPMAFETMPFMSFPWIFSRELGQIATNGSPRRRDASANAAEAPVPISRSKMTGDNAKTNQPLLVDDLMGDFTPEPLPEISSSRGEAVREGDLLDLFHDEAERGGDVAVLQPIVLSPTTHREDNTSPKADLPHRRRSPDDEQEASDNEGKIGFTPNRAGLLPRTNEVDDRTCRRVDTPPTGENKQAYEGSQEEHGLHDQVAVVGVETKPRIGVETRDEDIANQDVDEAYAGHEVIGQTVSPSIAAGAPAAAANTPPSPTNDDENCEEARASGGEDWSGSEVSMTFEDDPLGKLNDLLLLGG